MTTPSFPSIPRLLLAIALRVVLVAGVDRLFLFLIDRYDNSPDANIGLGILGFLVIMAVAALIGTVDGWRLGTAVSAIIWSLTAVLGAVAMIVLTFLAYPPYDVSVLVSDLDDTTVFLTGLVFVPAIVCAALASISRPTRPALQPT